MSNHTYTNWALKGLEGAANILEMVDKEGPTYTQQQIEDMDRIVTRLMATYASMQERVENA